MTGILFLLLNAFMIFSANLAAYRYFRRSSLAEQCITAFLIYTVQVTLSVIVLGSLVKDLSVVNLTVLNLFISVIIALYYKKDIKPSLLETFKKLTVFYKFIGTKKVSGKKDYFLFIFLFFFVLQVAATLYKIYFLPPHVGDVFAYHLYPMVNWLQEGQILTVTDTPVWRTDMNPLGSKFLHLWFVKFFGHITWIELPQFLFGIILSFTSYILMLKMKIQKRNALRYGILIYFMPIVLLHSRTCQDHLIFAALIFMALLYLVNIIFEKRPSDMIFLAMTLSLLFGLKKHSLLVIIVLFAAPVISRGFSGSRPWTFFKENRAVFLISGGIFLATCCYFIFIKNNMLYHKLFFLKTKLIYAKYVVFFAVGVLVYLGIRRLLKKVGPIKLPDRRTIIKTVIPIGVIVVLAAGVIILKNWSSIRPFLLDVRSPAMEVNRKFDTQYPALKGNFTRNLLVFPFRIRDLGLYTGYTPDLLEQSGFGVQFFAFGLIGYLLMVPLCIFKKGYRDSILGFLVFFSLILLLIYFFIYFTWANYRTYAFFGIIGIMCWAYLLEICSLPGYLKRTIDVLMVIMIVFNAAVCFYEGNFSPKQWKTLLTIDNPIERTSIKYSSLIKKNGYDSWRFIDRYIPPNEPIGFSGGGDAWTFPYFDNRLKRKIFFIKSLPGFAVKPVKHDDGWYRYLNLTPAFIESLKQRGIHYLHFATQGTPHRQKLFVAPGQEDKIIKLSDNLYYIKW